ncbi:chemotaxis protein CheW [Propionivibrio dicarboxylicus]|uniref:Chemotaxis protein CheA n=1 Tax=Propionivibrio dicarboxylicus TaxID=83767 RepID=A0A1G8J4E3_9RHOO|nr:chemotaxis protein CheW [Propionivibrio dicarboxylicus]SDI25530.1 two-component system, chemotaxis family, sensor kinase CheA [Propionivibrio dicarboxylicus]
MSYDLSQFEKVFFEEAREHLETMERLLLSIDLAAPDPEDLNAIFRAAHSIKGGSGIFGFPDMAGVTHVLESLLDRVRRGDKPLTPEIIDASLKAGDVLNTQLANHRNGVESDPGDAAPVIATLTQLMGAALPVHVPLLASPTLGGVADAMTRAAPESSVQGFRIEYRVPPPCPVPFDVLRAELERLGPVSSRSDERGTEHIVLHTEATRELVESILAFAAAPEQYRIDPLTNDADGDGDGQERPTSAVLEDDSFGFFVDPEPPTPSAEDSDGFGFFVDVEAIKDGTDAGLEDQDGYGLFADPHVAPVAATMPPVPVPASAAEAPRNGGAQNTSAVLPDHPMRRASDREAETSIRVSVEKVDQLINLIGELVITHAMLAQTISRFDPVLHENLFNGMAQLERNSRDMQEAVMSIRMLPIGSVFSRFPRLVRDLAGKLGKEVELKLVGENTELDKGLIERLSDPLNHLVRNSLDHGIERPEVRLAAGKPAKGRLSLQAYHQGGNIIIEVIDDGGGLNRERIIAKAQQKGIPVNPEAPDQEIWPLIFAPGFSTAAEITDVSGRGVGMDVVKRNIEGMGGRVEISSQQGCGTRISIRLPLTLAILDGMSIGVGDQVFILPLNMIVESLQPKADEVSSVSGQKRVVHVRGEYLPLVALHGVFRIPAKTVNPCEGIVVILEVDGGRVALLVDDLLGQHQVVIKSLETNYRKVRGISGATIMGDGRVALIVDVVALIHLSRS